MPRYDELSPSQRASLLGELKNEYKAVQEKSLKLDMSRGKPEKKQLDLSDELFTILSDAMSENGTDCRNYGLLDGLPEAKRLMASILGTDPANVFVGGNASLSLMHDCLSFACMYGLPESSAPWMKLPKVKILCPVPGYDRHFGMVEHMGFELIPVHMTAEGPDMDAVEELVRDESVKAIWCVPKYSNPQGVTYSDDVVRRFASLNPCAPDFRILWDNAYAVHDLDEENPDVLLNLMDELKDTGKENMAFLFASTSKITYSGGGISAVGMSKSNFDWFMKHKFYQTISYDKINQLRHCKIFPDMESIQRHMAKHAEILRPKFRVVLDALEALGEAGIACWDVPRGGYFISLNVPDGCAKRTVELCKDAGVVLTPAGATHPYGKDPDDRNIRIAPTFPPIEELQIAVELLCLCTRIAALEALESGKPILLPDTTVNKSA